MKFVTNWTNGCTFGIEHMTAPSFLEDIDYMVVIHLFFVKVILLKYM